MLQLAADLSQLALKHFKNDDFVPSPTPGVERFMLDRLGDEVAR